MFQRIGNPRTGDEVAHYGRDAGDSDLRDSGGVNTASIFRCGDNERGVVEAISQA